VTPSGGFNGQVSLSASGLPLGASFTFSPNPATSSSTLTVATSPSTPVGTYTVTVNGLSGSLSRSATVTLTVQAGSPPDFSLSVTPSSQTVAPGGAVSYLVTITPSGGFAGVVSLSASGLPSGAFFTFNPSPASTSSTMTIQTVASSPTGTYTVTIYGLSGSLFRQTTVALVVQAAATPAAAARAAAL
jgi:serine protease AprX